MLSCAGVGLRKGGRTLLDDVSLNLQPGKMTALLGPNGAGKSSLLKVMAGSWRPTSGTILASGRRLETWDAKALARRRAVLSQESRLAFNFRVQEVVLMGRSPHHHGRENARDRAIAAEALKEVGADALAQRDYLKLSGGEKQRVHLARVLAQIWEAPRDQDPDPSRALLLDEPVNNLDIPLQHGILRAAQRRCEQGVAVLTILHDLNLAFEYADEMVLVREGRIAGRCPNDPDEAAALMSDLFGWPLKVGVNPYTGKRCALPACAKTTS